MKYYYKIYCMSPNESYHMQHILLNTIQKQSFYSKRYINSESLLNEENKFAFVLVFKEEEGSEWQPSSWWACGWGVC